MGNLVDPVSGVQSPRRVNAFLRGPIVAGNPLARYRLSVTATRRALVPYDGALERLPEPQDNAGDDYGIQSGGGFRAVIVKPDRAVAQDHYWSGLSLRSEIGDSPISFARNAEIPVPDWQRRMVWGLANEFVPFRGLRRVRNLLVDSEGFGDAAKWALVAASFDAATNTLTATASASGARVLSSPQATVPRSSVVIHSAELASGTVGTASLLVWDNTALVVRGQRVVTLSASKRRYQLLLTGVVPGNVLFAYVYVKDSTLSNTGDSIKLYSQQLEDAGGAALGVAGEYIKTPCALPWPYYGHGVDGVKWFKGPNGNTVDAGGLIAEADATGKRVAWLHLPGRVNNFAEAPDSANQSWAGDIRVEADTMCPNGAYPATYIDAFSKDNNYTFGQSSWIIRLGNLGEIVLFWSATGGALLSATSNAVIPASAMPGVSIAAVLDVDNGAGGRTITFEYRRFGETAWTPLGTPRVQAGVTSVFDSTAPLRVGVSFSAGNYAHGAVLGARLINPATGQVVVNFDATRFAVGASSAVMSTGETWTINTSGAGNVARIVEAFTPETMEPCLHSPDETQLNTVNLGAWSGSAGAAQDAVAIDGTVTAWTLTDASAGAAVNRFKTFAIANDAHTHAVLIPIRKDTVAAATRVPEIALQLYGGTVVFVSVQVDTSTGQTRITGQAGTVSVAIDGEEYADWWMLRLTAANNTSGNVSADIIIAPASGAGLGNLNAATQGAIVAMDPFYVGGVTSSKRAEVYAPVNSGARPLSVLSLPPTWINDAAGVAYLELKPANWTHVVLRNAGNTATYIGCAVAGTTVMQDNGTGAYVASFDGTTIVDGPNVPLPTGRIRGALAWGAGKRTAFHNGVPGTEGLYDGAFFGTGPYQLGSVGGTVVMAHASFGPFKSYRTRLANADVAALNGAIDPFALTDWVRLRDSAIGTVYEMELASELTRQDGSVIELADTRTATVKGLTVRRGALELQFADIDVSRLGATYPIKKYTKEEFPNVYTEHLSRCVADGVGTLLRVPMTWIDTVSGTYRFAVCEKRTGITYTILNVYRDGRLVAGSEYTTNARASVTGWQVVTVEFAAEQKDGNGRLYELEADLTISGSREPSAEVARILALAGITVDAASVAAAVAVDAAAGILVDPAYARERTFKAIVEDLLIAARCDLIKTATGAWALSQDKAKTSVAALREDSGLIDVDAYEIIDPPDKLIVKYRQRQADADETVFEASRTLGGTGKTQIRDMPYVYDGTVADKLADFYGKREKTMKRATVRIMAAQFYNGDLIDVVGVTAWSGSKGLLLRGVQRIADGNAIDAREYDGSIYTYTAGTIPAAATVGYQPDYAKTPPGAPATATIVSNTTDVDASGKAFTKWLVRATPPSPSVNWSQLWARVVNNVTGAITARIELKLNAGNYEATIGTLTPSQSHTLQTFATNAFGLEGAVTSPAALTTATYSGAPPTPTGQNWIQQAGDTLVFYCDNPTYAHHERTEWEVKAGAGSFVTQAETSNRLVFAGVTYGVTYQARMRFRDQSGNYSAYPGSTLSATPTAQINDTHIVGLGVGTASINTSAVRNGKLNTGGTTTSVNVSAGTVATFGWTTELHVWRVYAPWGDEYIALYAGKTLIIGATTVSAKNTHPTDTIEVYFESNKVNT